MSTRNKLKYIQSTNLEKFENLGVEILELHNNISKNVDSIGSLAEKVENASEIGDLVEINKQVTINKDNISIIGEKLENISENHLHINQENLSINKIYEYDSEDRVTREISSGDVKKETAFKYNNKGFISEENIFENGVQVASRKYTYDDNGNVIKVESDKADKVNVAVMDYAIKDITSRIKRIEDMDFVGIAESLTKDNVDFLINKVKELSVIVESLVNLLPENFTSLINIPDIINRLTVVENKVNSEHMTYTFEVSSNYNRYSVPGDMNVRCFVYMEGLLLENNEDYRINIEKSEIEFLIPLIDGFEVQCRY